METKVRQFLTTHSLLEPSDRLAVAYSGGPDSTCLLALMRAIHPDTSAIYINHHLRGDESQNEEDFVREFCRQRNIPLFVEHIRWKRRPSNLEETARKRRYLHLTKASREHGFTKVALAHHRDDAAETFLLRLLRGAGPRGLAGPPPKRGIFIRPLLTVSRREIEEFLKKQQMPFFTDSSNFELRFLRNRIRQDLLPQLENAYNPQIRNALSKASAWIHEQNLLLEELMKPVAACIRQQDGRVSVLKKDLSALSIPLRKEVLRLALFAADPGLRPDAGLLQRLLEKVAAEENLELPGFLMVESSRDEIVFTAKSGPTGFHEIDIPCAGSYAFPPGGLLLIFSMHASSAFTENADVAYVDAEKAPFPLRVRNWKKGDRFRPLGMEGTQKLSDFWIDRKVPRTQRKRIPLVYKDDDLVWVAGHRLSHDFRVTESTRSVLKIQLSGTHG